MSSTPVDTFDHLHRPSALESPTNYEQFVRSPPANSSSSFSEEDSSDQSDSISIHVNANILKSQTARFD